MKKYYFKEEVGYKKLSILFVLLLVTFVSFSQTPGLIIKPATGNSVLDPNGDGYVSQLTNGVQIGFTIPPDNDVTTSEIPYVAIIRPDPLADVLRGPIGGYNEIVGVDAAGNNAILTYDDGTNLLFRFRLGGYAPNSKSYSLLIDTDQKFGFTGVNADDDALNGNLGFEVEIVLKTNFTVDVYDIDGVASTGPGNLVISYLYDNNCQKSVAISTASGDPDYFYDFFVTWSDISSVLLPTDAVRIVAITTMNPDGAIGNNALSDVGGVTTGTNIDAIFQDLIDEQTPTVPGDEVIVRSECPTIDAVSVSDTEITGTTTETTGTIIVLVYDTDGTTLLGSHTIANAGSPWTVNVSDLSPSVTLAVDQSVKAKAHATDEGESYDNCDIETVLATACTPPAAPTLIDFAASGKITVTYTHAVAGDKTITVYNSDGTIWSSGIFTAVVEENASVENGSPETSNGKVPGGTYYATVTFDGCESDPLYACFGVVSADAPTVDAFVEGATTLTGTGVSGEYITVFIEDVRTSTTTVTVGNTWSVNVPALSIGSKVVAEQSLVSDAGISTPGNGKCATASTDAYVERVANAPVINSGGCYTTPPTTIDGFSSEIGATIELFLSSDLVTSIGSATVLADGTWEIVTISPALAAGNIIVARVATAGYLTQSATSDQVTITTQSSSSGLAITTPIVYEQTTTLSGTGSDGDEIRLYVGDADIGITATVSGTSWTISSIPTYEFYIGAEVYVTAKAGSNCESDPSASKTVQCDDPTPPTYTGDEFTYCLGGAGSLSVTSTQTGVMYQLVNSSGDSQGPASVGNGGTITVYTNALNSDLNDVYVKAYKIGYSSCSATSSTEIDFTPSAPVPSVTLSSSSLSVIQGTTSVNLPYSSKSTNPDADTYTIDYSIAANAEGFTDITSETTIPFSPIVLVVPAAAAEGTYNATLRVAETGGSSCYSYNDITITVYSGSSPPVISAQPQNTSICSGTTTTLTVTAVNATSYQWQTSSSYAGTYSYVIGGSGGTTASYTTPSLTANTYYKVVVTNANGSTTSDVATVTVNASPDVTGFATSVTDVCAGNASVVTLSATSLPDGDYTVNYTLTGDNAQGATDVAMTVSGGNSGTFNTPVLNTAGTTTVTINSISLSGCTTATPSGNTDDVTITANPNVTGFATSVTDVCAGNPSVVTLSATSLPNGTYTVNYTLTGTNAASAADATMEV
ncbi:hypothetical protein ACFLRY_00620, partial [Bacteroidota bacterium]